MTVTREYVLDHFDEVCDRAEQGEQVVLERPGKARLELVSKDTKDAEPYESKRKRHEEAMDRIRERMLSRPSLEGVTIRELIDEGRRY